MEKIIKDKVFIFFYDKKIEIKKINPVVYKMVIDNLKYYELYELKDLVINLEKENFDFNNILFKNTLNEFLEKNINFLVNEEFLDLFQNYFLKSLVLSKEYLDSFLIDFEIDLQNYNFYDLLIQQDLINDFFARENKIKNSIFLNFNDNNIKNNITNLKFVSQSSLNNLTTNLYPIIKTKQIYLYFNNLDVLLDLEKDLFLYNYSYIFKKNDLEPIEFEILVNENPFNLNILKMNDFKEKYSIFKIDNLLKRIGLIENEEIENLTENNIEITEKEEEELETENNFLSQYLTTDIIETVTEEKEKDPIFEEEFETQKNIF